MANIDFTLGDFLEASAVQTREIVREELTVFEPKMKKLIKLENMESEARIKQEIKHFVSVDMIEMKKRLKSAAILLGQDD